MNMRLVLNIIETTQPDTLQSLCDALSHRMYLSASIPLKRDEIASSFQTYAANFSMYVNNYF